MKSRNHINPPTKTMIEHPRNLSPNRNERTGEYKVMLAMKQYSEKERALPFLTENAASDPSPTSVHELCKDLGETALEKTMDAHNKSTLPELPDSLKIPTFDECSVSMSVPLPKETQATLPVSLHPFLFRPDDVRCKPQLNSEMLSFQAQKLNFAPHVGEAPYSPRDNKYDGVEESKEEEYDECDHAHSYSDVKEEFLHASRKHVSEDDYWKIIEATSHSARDKRKSSDTSNVDNLIQKFTSTFSC